VELPLKSSERPALSKAQTAKKAVIPATLGAVIASATYSFVKDYVNPEIWASFCVAAVISIKDVLKYKFKLF